MSSIEAKDTPGGLVHQTRETGGPQVVLSPINPPVGWFGEGGEEDLKPGQQKLEARETFCHGTGLPSPKEMIDRPG